MKYFIWKFNPKIIKLPNSKNITYVVPKSKSEYYKTFSNVLYVTTVNFKEVYHALKNVDLSNIEDVFTLDEECMDWVGVLKSILIPIANSNSNFLFKDKYFMRSVLQNVVAQPEFTNLDVNNINNIFYSDSLAKPRNSDSAKGIIRFQKQIEPHKLMNQQDYIGNNTYMVEEFVDYDKMFTVDGYTDFQGHERFFSHEYNSKISDFSSTGFLTLHTNSFYYTNLEKLQRLFMLSKKVLLCLASSNEIVPFHLEWFYSTKRDQFIFTEVGKRFGGAKIPELIRYSFNIDILKEYWALQENNLVNLNYKIKPENFIPKQCSTTYMQFQNGKQLTRSLEKYIPNKLAYNEYFDVNVKSIPARSISDVLFSTQYHSKSVSESNKIASKINSIFKQYEV